MRGRFVVLKSNWYIYVDLAYIIQCTPDIVSTFIVAIRYSSHFSWYTIHFFYYIQVRNIVANRI